MEMDGFEMVLNTLPETITAPRTDPIYNCHSYLTKVPIAAIQPFINTFTNPGELVVDFFAGSGMSGLAAITQGRRAHLSDISALGKHIAVGYMAQAPSHIVRDVADSVIAVAKDKVGEFYSTQRNCDGTLQEVIRTVWSFTYVCPSCRTAMIYYEHLDENGKAPKSCVSCNESFVRRKWTRGDDVPVEIVILGQNGRQIAQPVSKLDIEHIRAAGEDCRLAHVPSLTIDQTREMYSRSGLGRSGMTETRKFFSARNAIALLELWKAINVVDDEDVRQKLRFAFTAILPRASKRYQWSAQRPLNAQNQTYYIAPVYYEWNIFDLFSRKINAVTRASDLLFPGEIAQPSNSSQVSYDLASADNLSHLRTESVDYIFTDPPFGSNIFYSDMNLFHEAWLGAVTDHAAEAVVYTTGARKNGAEQRYEHILRGSFCEALRILKPGKCMSVVFGNSSGRIWGLVQRAMRDAGFKSTPLHVAILDKGQRSVKGLNSGSEAVVTVDLVITVQKPKAGEAKDNGHELRAGDTADLISAAISELDAKDARNPSHVYARVLQKAIQKHLVLDSLHLGDVLIALRNSGFSIDRKTGLLCGKQKQDQAAVA